MPLKIKNKMVLSCSVEIFIVENYLNKLDPDNNYWRL